MGAATSKDEDLESDSCSEVDGDDCGDEDLMPRNEELEEAIPLEDIMHDCPEVIGSQKYREVAFFEEQEQLLAEEPVGLTELPVEMKRVNSTLF